MPVRRGGWLIDDNVIAGLVEAWWHRLSAGVGAVVRRRQRMRLYDTPDELRTKYQAACEKILLANPDAPLTYAKVARVLNCSERLLRGRLAEHGLDRPAEMERGIRAGWGQRRLR